MPSHRHRLHHRDRSNERPTYISVPHPTASLVPMYHTPIPGSSPSHAPLYGSGYPPTTMYESRSSHRRFGSPEAEFDDGYPRYPPPEFGRDPRRRGTDSTDEYSTYSAGDYESNRDDAGAHRIGRERHSSGRMVDEYGRPIPSDAYSSRNSYESSAVPSSRGRSSYAAPDDYSLTPRQMHYDTPSHYDRYGSVSSIDTAQPYGRGSGSTAITSSYGTPEMGGYRMEQQYSGGGSRSSRRDGYDDDERRGREGSRRSRVRSSRSRLRDAVHWHR